MEAEHHHALNMGVALSAFNPLRTPPATFRRESTQGGPFMRHDLFPEAHRLTRQPCVPKS